MISPGDLAETNRLDQSVAARANTLIATSLTNGSVALSWQADPEARGQGQYRIYSDMGSGYGVYVHKANTAQPAYIDRQLRPSSMYNYRLTVVVEQQEVVLAQAQTATFDRRPVGASTLSTQIEVSTAGVVTALPTALPPDAVLLGLISDNNYTDEFGTLTIVGEVRNDSNLTVGQTDITVTFYDSAGSIINTIRGETLLDVIPPGEKSPFVITLKRPSGLNSHSLRAVARPVAATQQAQLSVIETRRFEDEAGFFHVKGTIENVGSVTARRVKVATVIYDRSNRVINVGFTYANPPNLKPGQQAQYDVIFSYYPRYFSQHVTPFEE
jgi:hypothetical protein